MRRDVLFIIETPASRLTEINSIRASQAHHCQVMTAFARRSSQPRHSHDVDIMSIIARFSPASIGDGLAAIWARNKHDPRTDCRSPFGEAEPFPPSILSEPPSQPKHKKRTVLCRAVRASVQRPLFFPGFPEACNATLPLTPQEDAHRGKSIKREPKIKLGSSPLDSPATWGRSTATQFSKLSRFSTFTATGPSSVHATGILRTMCEVKGGSELLNVIASKP
ncbi:hypothetical protein B0J15DRAFT_267918 [Fusarium solani]|jgi:hypothetical protein|uniref:Uncharacterized protein n=1 Tax=Fusarium solani TaxID=169388 RepID=A0A9P9HW17_FUSSL|nr:uncharacterized protein B0J15DRAFT_267918 [Fusarium solani]KAH7264291.1 hypothetical protein B0J15DRAFT_267918 [Fusarium solani]